MAIMSWLQPFRAAFDCLLDGDDWLVLEENQRPHYACCEILIANY